MLNCIFMQFRSEPLFSRCGLEWSPQGDRALERKFQNEHWLSDSYKPKNSELLTSVVSTWHENCSLFRFLSSQSAKNYRFFSTEFYEPQKYKIFTFWRGWVGVSFPTFSFLVANQSSSDAQSVFFRCAINPLQISTSTSLRFYSCFYDDLLLLLGWSGWV